MGGLIGARIAPNETPRVVLELLGGRCGEYRRPCPQCDKRTRDDALAIRIDDRGATWFCHRCNFTGSCNEGRETRTVAGYKAKAERPAADVPQRWSERAEAIWRRSMPISGTIGEVYLKVRHCVIPPADGDLRFLPQTDDFPPCLLGRVTDFVTNEPMSLHFTKLRSDGGGKARTERDKILLKGHQKKGGVIRLWPNDSVTLSLALAEGIESALAAAKLHTPIWAAIDAGNLGALPVVQGIETIVIFADHDPVGIAAAQSLATRWRTAGRLAQAWMPTMEKADANDVLSGAA
jgi:phage/plasmid primase-like uncharacterized protein